MLLVKELLSKVSSSRLYSVSGNSSRNGETLSRTSSVLLLANAGNIFSISHRDRGWALYWIGETFGKVSTLIGQY